MCWGLWHHCMGTDSLRPPTFLFSPLLWAGGGGGTMITLQPPFLGLDRDLLFCLMFGSDLRHGLGAAI